MTFINFLYICCSFSFWISNTFDWFMRCKVFVFLLILFMLYVIQFCLVILSRWIMFVRVSSAYNNQLYKMDQRLCIRIKWSLRYLEGKGVGSDAHVQNGLVINLTTRPKIKGVSTIHKQSNSLILSFSHELCFEVWNILLS